MNSLLKYFTTVLFTFIFSLVNYAQQNIVDVPSSQIEEKGNVFFQQQLSLSNKSLRSGTTLTYGLGRNWEIGMNLEQLTLNLTPSPNWFVLDKEEPEESPDVLVNIQKGHDFTRWLSISAGTKSGINIPNQEYPIRYVTFSYLNSKFSLPDSENNFLILGGYYSNTAYSGEGNHWGYMIGLEADIIKNKFSFIGDYISGDNSLSYINSGLQLTFPGDWQLAVAAEIPPPWSHNHLGAVIQLSKK